MPSFPQLRAWISPDGAAALLAARGPQLAAGLLVIGIGVQSASIVTGMFGARDRPAAAQPGTGQAAPDATGGARRPDLNSILNAHLFGEPAVSASDAANAPRTSLALVLAGVIASEDPAKGYAIVGETAPTARMHAVGGALPGGARLHAVYADRIVLERGGSLESLALPRTALQGTAGAGVAPAEPVPAEPVDASDSATDPLLQQMREAMQRNPNALSEVIRSQQVLAGGKQRGFRVYPGSNPRAFSRLGLRPGDLVTEVNGTPLDDPSRGEEIMRTLNSSAEARVTILRNGRQSEVLLNLAQLANDPEMSAGNDGDASTSSSAP
jgi:general secretion pathway protein C